MRHMQAIIIYLSGHLLLIPASICFRAKALLGVINLVSVSPYRAARARPLANLPRRVRSGWTGFPNPERGEWVRGSEAGRL